MLKKDVKTPENMIVYLTDCTLATVSALAAKRKPPVFELKRQIAIAQFACDYMDAHAIDPRGTRADEVVSRMTVEKWAERFLPEPKEKLDKL